MAEYISREAFKAEIRRLSTHYLNEWDTLGVLAAADRIPAADVRPVVRGKWIETKTGFHCSACKTKAKGTKNGALLSNYCPNCGAMMEGS